MKALAMLAVLALVASPAQAASVCVEPAEAEALTVALLPDLLTATAATCAPSLPPGAMLRDGTAPLVARYRAEADAGRTRAASAIGKLGIKELGGIDPAVTLPLLTALAGPEIAKSIKPKDCARVDRLVTALAPLPARNVASIVVTLIEIATEKDRKPFLTICPAAPR